MYLVRILCIATLASFGAPAIGQSIIERAERDEITHMASEEPAMREAFRKARASLEQFLLAAERPREGTSDFALKVAISDGQNTEYFWVNAFSRQGDRFSGTLNNEPRMVKKHRLGERITFSAAQIADWTYIDRSTRRMWKFHCVRASHQGAARSSG